MTYDGLGEQTGASETAVDRPLMREGPPLDGPAHPRPRRVLVPEVQGPGYLPACKDATDAVERDDLAVVEQAAHGGAGHQGSPNRGGHSSIAQLEVQVGSHRVVADLAAPEAGDPVNPQPPTIRRFS